MTDLRPVSIRAVEQRRDAIVEQALRVYIGQAVDIDRLVASVRGLLPAGIAYDAVFESLRYLAGKPLSELDAVRVAWRLAGNLPTLKTGQPVPPWTSQHYDEWVPMQIMRVFKTRNSKDKIGYDVTSRVLAGTSAPLKVSSFWNVRVIKFVASKMGFSRPWDKYPFRVAADLVGLRFFGLIEAARCRGRPEFHEVECPASMAKWNRDNVLKLRLRVGCQCPVNFTHPCHLCAYGYDRCAAATHPKTFTIGPCAGCSNQDALFDPDDTSPHCVNCAAAARLRKKSL